MTDQPPASQPRKRRRDRGDDGIWWDKANKCYVGAVSLGTKSGGKRNRPSVRGRTKAEVKIKLDQLHEDLAAGIRTPATYTVEQCVSDWLDSIERDQHTMATITGQAKNWIYPKIGPTKLKDFTATDAEKFFDQLAKSLGKRALVMIKSTLRRSIRRAQVHNLIGKNVIEISRGVVHVWRSASKTGDTKTPKSKRSLTLPRRAVTALKAHQARQDRERLEAGEAWQAHNLVFCHENGTPYTSDALNWRFSKMTRKAGIGHWHAHEGRHTAVSIMSSNGVPIQEISDTVGHKSTHVTETVYRHVIVPTIRGGATVMDDVFGAEDEESA